MTERAQPTDPELAARAIAGHRPKVVAVVHGETSTGVMQPLEPIVKLAITVPVDKVGDI